MIKFFRKIRHKLLTENNFNKYLIYAVGEIILVVIGILIALQINNFNDRQRENTYQNEMLSEVKNSLENDINDKTNILKMFKKAQFSINELLKMREHKEYSRDSVKIHLDRISRIALFFPYTDGAYEAIKSNGLDKISNSEIRNGLVNLYSYSLPSISMFVNELARPTMTRKFNLFDQIFPSELYPGENGEPQFKYDYQNFEETLQTDNFNELLKLSNKIVEISPRLEYLVRKMENMKEEINKELNKK